MRKNKGDYWNKKIYSRNEMSMIFAEVIMPHLIISIILCWYISFRFSPITGLICLVLSIILSCIINKRVGLI